MASVSSEPSDPYRPMPELVELRRPTTDAHRVRQPSCRSVSDHDPHGLPDEYTVEQDLSNDPTVEIEGQLDLDGGWVLRKYVNPREGDTITIHLERQKVAASIEVNEVEQQMTPNEILPHYKGWAWVSDNDEDHDSPKEALTARDIRARDRQQSQKATGRQNTVKSSRGKPGRSSVKPAEASPPEVNRDLSVIPESPEGSERRVPETLEEVQLLSGLGNQPTVSDTPTAQTQGPPRNRSGARRPTHPSSIAQNIAGLGARKRSTQFMDGLGEDIRRQSAAAREAREAAHNCGTPEAAAPSAVSNKRKAPDTVTSQKRPRRSQASEIQSEHIEEDDDEVGGDEVLTQPAAKEKKKKHVKPKK